MSNFTNFLWAMGGALLGWLTVGLVFILYKYFKKYRPIRPEKKNVCLVIGNPGSGAKRFLDTQKDLQKKYSEILFYEDLYQAECKINGALSLQTPIDTFLIYGYFSLLGTEERWERFLTCLPIKHDYRHPLCHYVPNPDSHVTGTVVKLTRKDDYWLLQTLRAEDHKVVY